MTDAEIMEILKRDDEEFGKIFQEHRELDSQLAELSKKHYLTTEEELEEVRMKKAKLHRKDRMAEMVRDYNKKIAVGKQ